MSAALVRALALLLLLAPFSAHADWWSKHLEIHGELSSRLYLRSPGLEVGHELQMSSWRTEGELEALLRLWDTGDSRAQLTAIVHPVYEQVYDRYGGVWGSGAQGPGPGLPSEPTASRAIDGETFPGHGACVEGEFCLVNQDTAALFTGQNSPGLVLSTNLSVGAAVAPWAAYGSRQVKVGGPATGSVFALAATGVTGAPGAAELAASLALAGTEVPGSAPAGLATPLNAYAGGLGDRGSQRQLPADLNLGENSVNFECRDNAHPTCWLREFYLDIEKGNTFLRLGRQQIVWGKMDSFPLQEIVNPIDQGLHNVFPPLEERRLPVWAARLIQSLGDVGPLRELSLELVWVVDRFTPTQIGQCGEPYAVTIACQLRADAQTHRLLNLALAEVDERSWSLRNSEPGAQVEFQLDDPALSVSLSAYWGFQDLPVVSAKNLYSVTNPNPAAMLFLQALGAGPLIDGLVDPGVPGPWTLGFDPYAHDASGAPSGSLAQANAELLQLWDTFVAPQLAPDPLAGWTALEATLAPFGFTQAAVALPWTGSEVVLEYPRVLTLGASLDYEWARASTVFRVEAAYEFDRGLTNTAKATLKDESDVLKLALGVDRPMVIPFLNPGREAFVSVQLLWEHIVSYDDGIGSDDGMVAPEHGFINTFYMQNYWMDDRLKLTTFFAVDWPHRAYVFGPKLSYSYSDSLTFEVGVGIISGRKQEHAQGDLCPLGGIACAADPRTWSPGQRQTLSRGLKRATEAPFFDESFADTYMERRDEIWFGVAYRF